MLIWPLSLYRDYIFPRSFFGGWVWVSFAWSVLAFVAVGLYPLYEGIPLLRLVGSGVLNRLRGRPSPTPSPAASSSSSIGHDEKVPVSPSGETSS